MTAPHDLKAEAALAFAALEELRANPLAELRDIEAAQDRFVTAGEAIKRPAQSDGVRQ